MNISTDLEQLKKLGENVKSDAADYASEVRKMYMAVEELANKWKGADNQAYIQQVSSYKADIENLGKVVDNFGTFLIETAANLTRVQNEIKSAAANL